MEATAKYRQAFGLSPWDRLPYNALSMDQREQAHRAQDTIRWLTAQYEQGFKQLYETNEGTDQ